jgi:hypothetical protein
MHPKYFVKSVLVYAILVPSGVEKNDVHSVVASLKPKQHFFPRSALLGSGRHLVIREYTAVKKTSVPANPTNK